MFSTLSRLLVLALFANLLACGAPPSKSYALGGTITGYTGTGLTLQNGDETLTIAKGATTFTFETKLATGTSFTVTAPTQPTSPSQTCTLTNATGTIADADLTNIEVACVTNTYVVRGAIEGYSGSGLVLANGSETLTISTGATSFAFTTKVASGASYSVSAMTQPASQTCTVSNPTGTVTSSDITDVRVVCVTNTYALSGTITGYTGSGLTLLNGGETLTIATGATTFAFTINVASGSAYAVTASTQPTSPSQTCTVMNGTGTVTTSAVSDIQVACTTNTYAVRGTITGYTGTGLTLINGAETLPVAANATTFAFTTRIASGSTYAVTAGAQPTTPSQTCVVTGGFGMVAAADVTSIQVTCTTNTYAVGGTITGYSGSGLTLMNGMQMQTVTSGATSFTFTNPISSGSMYAVTISTQPTSPSQTCTLTNATGTVGASAVNTIQVQCVTNTFPLTVNLTGLTRAGLVLQNNGADNLSVAPTANGVATATFTTRVASGAMYAVTVQTPATGGVCTLTGATGTVGNTAPTVTATCALGESLTFTTMNDVLNGTAGDDVFTGIIGSTYSSTDVADGGAGIDTLNLEHTATQTALPQAAISNIEILNVRNTVNLNSTDLSSFSDLTQFNVVRSTATATLTNAPPGMAFGLFGDGVALAPGSYTFGYAPTATVATLTLDGGVRTNAGTNVFLTGAGVTSTVINSFTAPNSLGTPGTAGVIVLPASSQQLTINATANATFAISSTQTSSLTVTGNAVIDVRGVNYGFSLNRNITTIDASRMTGGGFLMQMGGNPTSIRFYGGAGNDSFGLNALPATAELDGGAGIDTLRTNNATFITATTAPLISNFEIVDVAANITVDLGLLAPTNQLTGLRLGAASNVINNVTPAVASNVTIYASGSPNLNLIGATTPGQVDTVRIDVNDGLAAVNSINIGAPGLVGVENLFVTTTDNFVCSGLNNAPSLNSLTLTGAGNASVTTGAITTPIGATVNASAHTGNLTFSAIGSTANGWTVRGSSGVNVITGGNAPFTVDLTQSVARADTVIFTSAIGSTATARQIVLGFTNALTTGDRLDVVGLGTLAPNVAAGTATGIANLTAAITSGVVTFGGSAAATASLQNKIDAAASLAGTTVNSVVAFEHAGGTFVFQQGDTAAAYAQGVDFVIELTGVTGVTALSTTASAANTIYVQ